MPYNSTLVHKPRHARYEFCSFEELFTLSQLFPFMQYFF